MSPETIGYYIWQIWVRVIQLPM